VAILFTEAAGVDSQFPKIKNKAFFNPEMGKISPAASFDIKI
jgi:hypothetical protein